MRLTSTPHCTARRRALAGIAHASGLLYGLGRASWAWASPPSPGPFSAAVAVDRLLHRLQAVGISPQSCSLAIDEVAGDHPGSRVLRSVGHRPNEAMNPASCIKVYTAWGAAEILGPQHRFQTEIWGQDRTLPLNRQAILVRGGGDPKLLIEDLEAWRAELLAEFGRGGAPALGTALAFDGQRFDVPAESPGDFDQSPEKPYNVIPHACLMNFQSAALVKAPGAPLSYLPPLPGISLVDRVRWAQGCDARPNHQYSIARAADGEGLAVSGQWPMGCDDGQGRPIPMAYASPTSSAERFNHSLMAGLWLAVGQGAGVGKAIPAQVLRAQCVQRLSTWRSGRTLTELLGDVLTRSSNIISRHLLLEFDAAPGPSPANPGRAANLFGASARLAKQLAAAGIPHQQLQIDNGAGLSRTASVSARELNALLRSPPRSMPWEEWRDAFAVWGETGSARRAPKKTDRVIRVKTGSLRDVRSLCGYVYNSHGRLVIFTLIVNDAKSRDAREAFWQFVDDLAA